MQMCRLLECSDVSLEERRDVNKRPLKRASAAVVEMSDGFSKGLWAISQEDNFTEIKTMFIKIFSTHC